MQSPVARGSSTLQRKSGTGVWLVRGSDVKCEGGGGRGKTIQSLQCRLLKDFFLALSQTIGVGTKVTTGKHAQETVLP